jgi:predicted DCC family thiol-disulfide oxidoreductase YuxK
MTTHANILVYDGECGFCTSAAKWIVKRWGDNPGTIAQPRQRLDPLVIQRIQVHDDDLRREVWWLSDGGNASGAEAIGRALLAARGAWALVGYLILSSPLHWVAPMTYRFIARHRRHLPGGPPHVNTEVGPCDPDVLTFVHRRWSKAVQSIKSTSHPRDTAARVSRTCQRFELVCHVTQG